MPLKHYRFEMFANASRRVQACATGMGQARQYFCLRTCPRRWRKGRSVAPRRQRTQQAQGCGRFRRLGGAAKRTGLQQAARTALICGSAGGLLLGTTNGSEAVKEQVPPARFSGHQLGSQVLLCVSFRHVPQSQSSRLRQMPAPQLMRRRQALAMRRPDPAGE